jgi:hypothetical protein
VQESQLLQHQEQKDHYGTPGNEEILPALPEAPGAQGDQIVPGFPWNGDFAVE